MPKISYFHPGLLELRPSCIKKFRLTVGDQDLKGLRLRQLTLCVKCVQPVTALSGVRQSYAYRSELLFALP